MSSRVPRRLRGKEQGFIMFLTLGFVTLLGLGSVLAIDRTLGEFKSAVGQLRDKRAFFRADGGAALCRGELRNRLQTALPAQLASLTNVTAVSSYVPNDPAGLLIQYAYQAGTSFGGAFIRDSATQVRLPLTYTASAAPGPYTCTLTVISRGDPVNQGTTNSPQYLFRYRYTIDGTATDGSLNRQVNLQGIFSVLVQNENFARYALFTNQQTNATGSRVWFTNRTNFSGPVHTNGEFNFNGNPGSAFTGKVTSVSTTARYYNTGVNISLNADRNGNVDVPTFGEGFARGAANTSMPATTNADRQREAALGLPQGASTSGLPVGVHLGTAAGAMTGGIYVKGNGTNPRITLSSGGSGIARYTIVLGATTWTVTVNYPLNQTTIQQGSNPATTYSGDPTTGVPFNGMLFVDGGVDGLEGTVQRDTELTVAATGDVMITNNLTYENYTNGGSPSAQGATNLMGIMSWNGNVRIGTTAPNDISVHATVMTPNGEFRVDNYSSGSSRGTATILGGVIENTYGAFGTFSSTRSTGYGRNFVYDSRMGRGKSPPFFPTIGRVISTVSGVNDRPNWQQTN